MAELNRQAWSGPALDQSAMILELAARIDFSTKRGGTRTVDASSGLGWTDFSIGSRALALGAFGRTPDQVFERRIQRHCELP